jgi:hydrogenase nickel incorporation protein HypA/HybF
MHELPLVESLLTLACERALENDAKAIVGISLRIGELCDALPEWIERYFQKAAAGTIAEGARLTMSVEPALASCGGCGARFPPGRGLATVSCPECGSRDCALVAGLEWRLQSIEVV